LFFNILTAHKKARWPRAAHTGSTIYHYGWVRTEGQMKIKADTVAKLGRNTTPTPARYAEVDPATLRLFTGTHPRAIAQWLLPADGLFQADMNHRLTFREKKHRLMLKLEEWFGFKFNKKHYRLVAGRR
jgi:hypothetical protein